MCWSTSDRGAAINNIPHNNHAGVRVKVIRAVNDTAPKPNRCMSLSECGKGEYGGIGLIMPPIKINKVITKIKRLKASS